MLSSADRIDQQRYLNAFSQSWQQFVNAMNKDRVIVVGAGPAGLTAAWELVKAGHDVTILERDPHYIGGLARTMSYKGFRFDIGAHRFFSKSSEISRWWRERLPNDFIRIKRKTRILYRQRFFHYPLRAGEAMFGLGPLTSFACLLNYLWRQIFPVRPELSFEDWVRNRFGDRLYRIFFKTYTEKVWGTPCKEISADWASQRIKGLSLHRAISDAFGFRQDTVKTLVDEFEYPRLGAGMMWERTRDEIIGGGGRVFMGRMVTRFERDHNRIISVETKSASGETECWPADAFIVSMPLQDCAAAMDKPLDAPAQEAASKLSYRDFILAALVVNRTDLFPDNWLYVHDPAVKVGRIENYNNWGGGMVSEPNATCLEMEYFCSQGDSFWQMNDAELLELAKKELNYLGLAKPAEIRDGCVVRVEKAYPIIDKNYRENVNRIRNSLSHFKNLQVVGRNGMHKYNNQDHSMMTGILAARNLDRKLYDVWRVNTDAEYQEENEVETQGRISPQQIARSSCE